MNDSNTAGAAADYLTGAVPSHWKLNKTSGSESVFRCEFHIPNSFIIIPFTVFLKVRPSENRKDRVFIKKVNADEFSRLENPVFITAYVTEEEQGFWDWKHSAQISEGKENTIMVSVPRSKTLQERNWHIQPEEDLKRMFMEEHFLFRIPENGISENQKQAWKLFFQQEYTDALKYFQQSDRKDDPLLCNASAVCLWKLNQTGEAVSMIEKAVQSEGKNRRLQTVQAYILSEHGIIEKDIKSLNRALSVLDENSDEFSDSFFFHYCRGRTAMELPESTVDSISEMQNTLRLNPKFIPAKIALGICYDSPYAPEAGMPGPHDTSYFDEVLAEHPNHPEAALWKHLSFCKLKTQTREHLETLVKILEENPTLAKIHRDSWHWIAEGYEHLNEKDLALKYHEKGKQ